MAVDAEGDIYIAGQWTVFGGGMDILVARFTADGKVSWAKTWAGGAADRAYGIALDEYGSAYVCGHTESFGAGGADALLLKYDCDGNLEWARTWGGTWDDGLSALMVGPDGNVHAVGSTSTFGAGNGDCLVQEWSPAGDLESTRTWGLTELDAAYTLICSGEGHMYVAGFTASLGSRRALMLKYDALGDLLSSRAWTGESSSVEVQAWDSRRNMYLAGHALHTTGSWQDAQGTINLVDGILGTPEGSETELEGEEGTPEGIVTSPVGVEDTGAGGADVLLMKNFPG